MYSILTVLRVPQDSHINPMCPRCSGNIAWGSVTEAPCYCNRTLPRTISNQPSLYRVTDSEKTARRIKLLEAKRQLELELERLAE